MKCRYCGDNLRSINQKLFSSLGERCLGNPAGVHVCITDGINCVFCGNKTRFQNGKLITEFGYPCKNSTTGLHCLQ